ncbi:hypothetical protein PIB30_111234, partial [Stylosanthes scabra]|nr:hypothetical protein [Stylosanthes scabra]
MSHKWTDEETEWFVCAMEELVVEGQRVDAGQFKPGSFEKLSKKMLEKFPTSGITAKHCKNKHKRLKEKYQSAADMVACSGFGWSDALQCVVVDSKEQNPLRFYTPGKPFHLYPRLEAIFGKDRANGGFAMSGADAEETVQESDLPMKDDDTDMLNLGGQASDSQFQSSPVRSSSAAKRARTNSTKRTRGED